MIYQKTLKQLNAVFPKLQIQKPINKITVRSLIQELQCPVLVNHDFTMLKNPEAAPKVLNKMQKMINIWLKILETNQQARQQHQKRKINKKCLQKYQQIFTHCIKVDSKTNFIQLIQKQCLEVYQTTESKNQSKKVPTIKDYKQIYIANSIQYYNTITQISEDEYFTNLEQLTQNLNILSQLCQTANNDINNLEEFYSLVQNYQIFKKKDNALSRVINYNLKKTLQLSKNIQNIKNSVYFYQQNLTFSICRCYYLCFLARQDIIENRQNEQQLNKIKAFLCDRKETVFPKLFNRKISKCLIMFDQIDEQFKFRKYTEDTYQHGDFKIKKAKIQQKIIYLRDKLKQLPKPLAQADFLNIYNEIENLMIEIKDQQQFQELKKEAVELEQLTVQKFSFPEQENQNNRRYIQKNIDLQEESSLNISQKSKNQEIQQKLQQVNDHRISSGNKIDNGSDIFIDYQEQVNYEKPQNKQLLDKIQADPSKLKEQCQKALSQMNPKAVQLFQDLQNFNLDKVKILVNFGKKTNADFNQLRLLQLILKTILKPEISQQNFPKIFLPQFRQQPFKMLIEKLVQHRYHLNKLMNSSTFSQLPINIQNAVVWRELLIKGTLRQIQNIFVIGQTISKLQKKAIYDVCDQQTYETFLKLLLATKQCKLYRLSVQDEKNVLQSAKKLADEKFISPFLNYLDRFLPVQEKNFNVAFELDYIEFFVDFKAETNAILQKYINQLEIQQELGHKEQLKSQLNRILEKWRIQAENKLSTRSQIYDYLQAEQQRKKIQEIIKVCQKDCKNPSDKDAIRLFKILK